VPLPVVAGEKRPAINDWNNVSYENSPDLLESNCSKHPGYKAFTYRVVVTSINVGIDYYFIGAPFAAGVLVILQVFVNTTKFFFHEVMWQELFGVGPLQRDTPRVMDFVAEAAAGRVKTPLPMRPMGEGQLSSPKASPVRYNGETPLLIRPRMTW
jgi:uncharacterized membrane protein